MGYRVKNFSTGFKPIHAFYELEGVDGDAEITIEEVKGFAKFDVLLPNYLSKMLNDVRVFHVQVPWSMERRGEVHQQIYEHSKGIQ